MGILSESESRLDQVSAFSIVIYEAMVENGLKLEGYLGSTVQSDLSRISVWTVEMYIDTRYKCVQVKSYLDIICIGEAY